MPTPNSMKIFIYAHENCDWPSTGKEAYEVNEFYKYVAINNPGDTPILKFYLRAESQTPVFGIRYDLDFVNPLINPDRPQPGDIHNIKSDFALAPLTVWTQHHNLRVSAKQGRLPKGKESGAPDHLSAPSRNTI